MVYRCLRWTLSQQMPATCGACPSPMTTRLSATNSLCWCTTHDVSAVTTSATPASLRFHQFPLSLCMADLKNLVLFTSLLAVKTVCMFICSRVCVFVQSGACLIGGKCYLANEADPSEVCSRCLPIVNSTGWTYGKLSCFSVVPVALHVSRNIGLV